MRRVILVSFLAFFLLAACSKTSDKAQASVKASPKIEFAETSKSLGEVNDGADAQYIFVFKNKGNAVLHIEDVKGG